ncbi:MAG: hypothetical protein JEZ11_03910 [Desulfobacterales bacterium]|nr:hypothetical protein [Desulfobacterales bacterium]
MKTENIVQLVSFLKAGITKDGRLDVALQVDPDDHHLAFSYPFLKDPADNTACVSYLELIEALELAIDAQNAQKAAPSLTTHAAWLGDPEPKSEIRGMSADMIIIDDLESGAPEPIATTPIDWYHILTARMAAADKPQTPPDARLARYDEFMARARTIVTQKNHDYSGGKQDTDPNANFVEIARLLEGAPITPYTVAMIYKLKHVFSLLTFCKTGRQESGEALLGRHQDDSNYSFILNELVALHEECFATPDEETKTKLAA